MGITSTGERDRERERRGERGGGRRGINKCSYPNQADPAVPARKPKNTERTLYVGGVSAAAGGGAGAGAVHSGVHCSLVSLLRERMEVRMM